MNIRPTTRPDTAASVGNIQEALPFLFSLILMGVAGNFFRFPLFFDIDFLFGSIFALLALQFYGLRRGVIAAILISAYTIILWNHPYACLILSAEVAVVGGLFSRRKIGLVLADTLYWLCVGMPLVYFFYHGVMDVSWENTSIIMIKQAVNGIANALIARLLFAGYTLLSRSRFLPLREVISALLGFFVLFPALIFLAISSRDDFASNDQRIRAALRGIPCGLIVNELVSNSFKYAFPDSMVGRITVLMNRTEGNRYLLTVADNGVGFPEEIDFRQTTSLGLQLVTVLVGQLQGEISLTTDAGTRFTINFPGQTS